MNCPQCGAPVEAGAKNCKYCGESIAQPQYSAPPQPNQMQMNQVPMSQMQMNPMQMQGQMMNPQAMGQQQYYVDPTWPSKNKVTAGLLAILLGTFGIHKFYMGSIGMGILYLIFSWSFIPSVIGIIEGITYLTMSDAKFAEKFHVRPE